MKDGRPRRREMGGLEREVLQVLWASTSPFTPAQVLAALGDEDIAYTTVMTILNRLFAKGLVSRQKSGRAFAYVADVSEAELTAQRMRAHLDGAGDREAVLLQFVSSLSRKEERALRRLLAEMDGGA